MTKFVFWRSEDELGLWQPCVNRGGGITRSCGDGGSREMVVAGCGSNGMYNGTSTHKIKIVEVTT